MSAPELLDAARDALALLRTLPDDYAMPDHPVFGKLRRAIAKAETQPPPRDGLRDTVDAIAHALDEWLGPLSAEDTDRACDAIAATLAARYATDQAMEAARELGRAAARKVAEHLAAQVVQEYAAQQQAELVAKLRDALAAWDNGRSPSVGESGYRLAQAVREFLAAAPQPQGALAEALRGMLAIVRESKGVAGYHLNGEVAEWDTFPEVAAARDALLAQGVQS